MKKNRMILLGMAAVVLSFALVVAACGKKDGSGSGGARSTDGRAAPATDFAYELTEDGAGIKITKYTGKGGALVIPATIEDMPVTEIGERAFYSKTAITSVFVPDSITVIGSQAFQHNENLTKATLPDGLKVIPSALFASCEKLTSVNLPAGLEEIKPNAFYACGELNDITIPSSLTSIKWIDVLGEEIPGRTFGSSEKLPLKTRARLVELGHENF